MPFHVTHFPSGLELAELQVWLPEQGHDSAVFPLELEVRFSSEYVETPNHTLRVSPKQAEIVLVLEGCEIERGSRLGEYVRASSERVTHKVTLNEELERTKGISGGLFAKLFAPGAATGSANASAYVEMKQKISEASEETASSEKSLLRVIARTRNRWTLQEPLPPFVLDGLYIGEKQAGDEGYVPLCCIKKQGGPFGIKIWLRIPSRALSVSLDSLSDSAIQNRNQEAIVQQLIRRSVSLPSQERHGEQPPSSQNFLDVAFAKLAGGDDED